MSEDPEQEYFSDGITEEIITALSKTPNMFVIARTSSFKYKGKEVDVRRVGRELGVRYVLEGSVRKSEDKVRITAQLVEAKTGNHLWAERYERDLKDIFAIQDEVTLKVITSLHVKLSEGEIAGYVSKRIKRLDVYTKLWKLRWLWNNPSKENFARYGQLAQEIIDIAPESYVGYVNLGWYYWLLAFRGVSPRENNKKALELAQKCLSLDEPNASTYCLLSSVYLRLKQYWTIFYTYFTTCTFIYIYRSCFLINSDFKITYITINIFNL